MIVLIILYINSFAKVLLQPVTFKECHPTFHSTCCPFMAKESHCKPKCKHKSLGHYVKFTYFCDKIISY